MLKNIFHILLISVLAFGCNANQQAEEEKTQSNEKKTSNKEKIEKNAVAYFASGCFWCVEAVFESVIGVGDVISGYSGVDKEGANYRAVSAGITDHAEAVAVHYDSTKIDYPTLLKVFFGSHDPTTLNQQGPDRGEQYRSAIFYRNKTENFLLKPLIFTRLFPVHTINSSN
jgi:peptide-methionine (S)-S-oxide reductase